MNFGLCKGQCNSSPLKTVQGSILFISCDPLIYKGLPQVVLVVKNLPENAGDVKRCWFDPCVGKIPWKKKWQPTPVLLPEEFHGQSSLVCYSPWVAKSQTHLK